MKYPIYLDNNSTTQIDPLVLEKMLPVLKHHFGNPASSTHAYGWYAAELVEAAREQVAKLLNADSEEIIFTSGATESINLVLQGITKNLRKAGNEKVVIISCSTEHSATLECLMELTHSGVSASILPTNREGQIDISQFTEMVSKGASLVSLMHANNEIGTFHPIKELAAISHKLGIPFHCDASQTLGKVKIDVKDLQIDYLSCSSHKVYGPKGVGALFIKNSHKSIMPLPMAFGGGHEKGLRPGTLNVAGIVGFGQACELANSNLPHESKQLKILAKQIYTSLYSNFPQIILNGTSIETRLPGNLNIAIPEVSSAALIGKCNTKIAISATSACKSAGKIPSHVLNAIELSPQLQKSSFRIGIGRFNTTNEIEAAADIITLAVKKILA